MKRCFLLVLTIVLVIAACSASAVEQDPYLDSALRMLEKGNDVLEHYNAQTGANLEVWFDQGVPYFFGGQDSRYVFSKWPNYIMRKAWQDSDYFRRDQMYFSGFDCVGFVKHVYSDAGVKVKGKISDLIKDNYCKHHIWCSAKKPLPESWTDVAAQAKPGDIFLIKHPGFHVMMFAGTMRGFGYTENDLAPELLDLPLMVHCAGEPSYPARFQALIDTSPLNYVRLSKTTDGGVGMAILGAPLELCEEQGQVKDTYMYWIVLDKEGSATTVRLMDLSEVVAYAWYRP